MKYVHGWAFPDEDAFMAKELKADGSYQGSHLRAALAHVTDWSVAIDAGAHVGTWSKTLAGRFSRVLAFEPSPDTFAALQTNMDAFDCHNVATYNQALGALPGHVSMTNSARGLELQNTGARYVQDDPASLIERITVDSLNLPTLGLLKMDVEGSEPLILMGARATLLRCRPIVIYENKGFCRRYGMEPIVPRQLLQKAGYQLLQKASMDDIWGPVR